MSDVVISDTHANAVESALAAFEAENSTTEAATLKSEIETLSGLSGEAALTEETTESEPTEEATETTVKDKEDPAVARLSEREEALRKKEADLESVISRELEKRIPKFDDEDKLLEHYKVDKDLLFKRMLFSHAKDGPLKEQLKEELRDYHTKKELDSLRNEIKNKEVLAQQAAFRDKVISDARKSVESVSDKSILHQLVKSGKTDYVHSKVMAEITRDAEQRLARGEDGDILPVSEAMKRVEEDLKVLAEVFGKQAKAPEKVKPSVSTPVSAKPISQSKMSREQMIELAIKQAELELRGNR